MQLLQVYKTRGALGTIAIIILTNMLILCFQLSIKSTTQHVAIELRTFLTDGKSDILGLGYKTEEGNGRRKLIFVGAKFVPKTKTRSYKMRRHKIFRVGFH